MTTLLELSHVARRFDGLLAVDDVSFTVAPGTIHAVIGPNGAGKTTLFNLVSGLLPLSSGSIRFGDTDLARVMPHMRARLGIARTFQNIRVFGEMSLLENTLIGLHGKLKASMLAIAARLGGFRSEERAGTQEAMRALAFVGLEDRSEGDAVSLSYGEQRRLEIARAIVSRPTLLLLDEPAAGLNQAETAELALLVRRIREAGTTIVLVEHDMKFVMDLSDRVTVLNFGRRIFEGEPAEVKGSPVVIEAYLGKKVAARLLERAEA